MCFSLISLLVNIPCYLKCSDVTSLVQPLKSVHQLKHFISLTLFSARNQASQSYESCMVLYLFEVNYMWLVNPEIKLGIHNIYSIQLLMKLVY